MGEIAAAYNELADRNARMDEELVRIGRVVGREGRMTERASLGARRGAWERSIDSINALIDDLVRPTTEVARVIDAVADGRPDPEDGARDRGPVAQGRVPPHRHDRERDGRPARLVRRRGHARRPRGRHRGQARRPGRGPGRLRHLARPDRERQLDGQQPHRPGAQHRPGRHRGRRRRPLAEDHRRRQAARSPRSRTRSTRWSTSSTPSPPRSRASRARSAPRASSAARPRSRTCPAPGAT